MSEEPEIVLPFGLTSNQYVKILKRIPNSLQNWKVRSEKSRDYSMIVESWTPSSKAVETSNNHKKTEYQITAVHYMDSEWIICDSNGKYHRLTWEAVYKNTNFDHHTSPGEVNQIIKKCKNVVFYE